jgi:hypothetical protein
MDKEDFAGLSRVQRYVLALLAEASDGAIRDHLRLQKALYLLSRQSTHLQDDLGFEPHFQGPYSETVESSTADLAALGYVRGSPAKGKYSLVESEAGEIRSLLAELMPAEPRAGVRAVVTFLKGLTNDELLLVVYTDNNFIGNQSVVRTNVFENRIKLATSLLRKGKVTLSRAAELADLSLGELEKAVPQNMRSQLIDDKQKASISRFRLN